MVTYLGVAQVRVGNTAAESNWADGTDVTDNPKVRQTRSSWLNCALPDDDSVHWVSIGHYEAVAVGD